MTLFEGVWGEGSDLPPPHNILRMVLIRHCTINLESVLKKIILAVFLVNYAKTKIIDVLYLKKVSAIILRQPMCKS